MQISNSLSDTLIGCFPDKQHQILELFSEHRALSSTAVTIPLQPQSVEASQMIYPHFGQLIDRLKSLLGIDQFRQFLDYYINKNPDHNQLIKQELCRLEKEALLLETKEQEKFLSLGLPSLPFEGRDGPKLYSHQTLTDNMEEEFKNAKWVVLTSPLIQQKVGVKPVGMQRENSLNPAAAAGSSGNFTIQLPNLGQNSNSRQASSSQGQNMQQLQAAAQAKLLNQPPQKRYGHSACLVMNKMYIFGGLASHQKGGNLQTFFECQLKFANPSSNETIGSSALNNQQLLYQWDKIKAEAPRARDSHTVIHIRIQVGDSLIMFGGSGGVSSFNDLYKFDLRLKQWHKLEPYGELPPHREGHIAKLIGKDKMFVHGGVDQSETSFSDTYILSGISQFIDNAQISSIYAAFIPQSDLVRQSEEPGTEAYMMQGSNSYLNGNEIQNSEIQSIPRAISGISNESQKPNSSQTAPEKLRWFKCIDRGTVPQGRDSHSSALINNKLYIFGGQGDGDIIFDDLYSCQILEEQDSRGNRVFVAQWELIEPQTPKGVQSPFIKPRARTSHSCTVYKNRYMIIIGGEGEYDDQELAMMKLKQTQRQPRKYKSKKKHGNNPLNSNEEDIQVEIDPESDSEYTEMDGPLKKMQVSDYGQDEESKEEDEKKKFNDIWAYDTLTQRWFEIQAPLKLQGPLSGKKLKREFEARMAHSAVQLNQFVVVYGGLGPDQLVSNDLYVLSLDGNLGAISQVIDDSAKDTSTNLINQSSSTSIQIPNLRTSSSYQPDIISIPMPSTVADGSNSSRLNRQQSMSITIPAAPSISIQNSQVGSTQKIYGVGTCGTNSGKATKTLKIGNPEDRKIMTGQILNQIINFNQGSTHQYIINGGSLTNNLFTSQSQEFISKKSVQKKDSESQTLSDLQNEPADVLAVKTDHRKQAVMIMQKQNDYRLSGYQRTRFPFIKSISEQIIWPLQCFGSFIDNSIEAFDLARQKLEATKINAQSSAGQNMSIQIQNQLKQNLDIDIALKNTEDGNGQVLEVKDNGIGIHPKQLMELLTSFGSSNVNQKSKSDYGFSEHGLGLKLACLRLASSSLIITKTRPVSEFGTTSFYLSIALLSQDFMKRSDSLNGFLTAPIVSYEIKNRKQTKNLTPEPDHFLNMISQFTKTRFDSGEKILQYAMNGLGEGGATHIFMFNLTSQKLEKNGPQHYELISKPGDVVLNQTLFPIPNQVQRIEQSLQNFLNYLYVEYPPWVRIRINGIQLNLKNPYSILKNNYPQAYQGDKQDKFAVQFLDDSQLTKILDQIQQPSVPIKLEQGDAIFNNANEPQPYFSQVDNSHISETTLAIEDAIRQIRLLQGVLIYRGNRLIRRLESVIGEDDDNVICHSINKTGESDFAFKTNAIVSVFKSRSSTTLDKKDFQEKLIIRKIKEWFRQKSSGISISVNAPTVNE